MTTGAWLALIGAVFTGIAGIVTAWAAVVRARNETKAEVSGELADCRREAETQAAELHRWRMKYPGETGSATVWLLVAAACMVATALLVGLAVRLNDQATPGPPGPPGPIGARGPQGPPGLEGLPGVSVEGPQGPPGDVGSSGTAGSVGSTGAAGTTGSSPAGSPSTPAAPGPAGPAGPPGPPGADGTQGPQGRTGDPGPLCPPGYTSDTIEVKTSPGTARILVCRAH